MMFLHSGTSRLKSHAKKLKTQIENTFSLKLNQSQVLDLVACVYGFESWNQLYLVSSEQSQGHNTAFWECLRTRDKIEAIKRSFPLFVCKLADSVPETKIIDVDLSELHKVYLSALPQLPELSSVFSSSAAMLEPEIVKRRVSDRRSGKLTWRAFCDAVYTLKLSAKMTPCCDLRFSELAPSHYREGLFLQTLQKDDVLGPLYDRTIPHFIEKAFLPARHGQGVLWCARKNSVYKATQILLALGYQVTVVENGRVIRVTHLPQYQYDVEVVLGDASIWHDASEEEIVAFLFNYARLKRGNKLSEIIIRWFVAKILAKIADGEAFSPLLLPDMKEIIDDACDVDETPPEIQKYARTALELHVYDYARLAKAKDPRKIELYNALKKRFRPKMLDEDSVMETMNDILGPLCKALAFTSQIRISTGDVVPLFDVLNIGHKQAVIIADEEKSPYPKAIWFSVLEHVKQRHHKYGHAAVEPLTVIADLNNDLFERASGCRFSERASLGGMKEDNTFFDFHLANAAKIEQVYLASELQLAKAMTRYSGFMICGGIITPSEIQSKGWSPLDVDDTEEEVEAKASFESCLQLLDPRERLIHRHRSSASKASEELLTILDLNDRIPAELIEAENKMLKEYPFKQDFDLRIF